MSQNLDPLYLEAAKVLLISSTSENQDRTMIKDYSVLSKQLTRQQYYIYICILTFTQPKLLLNYLQKEYGENNENGVTFLKALLSISLVNMGHQKKRQFAESIYENILNNIQLRQLVINKHLLPYSAKVFSKEKQIIESQKKLLEIRYISRNQIQDFHQDSKGCAKLMLILSKLYRDQSNCQEIWSELLICFGEYQISTEKLLFSILNTTIKQKRAKECLFFLIKLQELMEIQTLLEILVPSQKGISQDQDLTYRGKLCQLMENKKQSFQPSNLHFQALILLVKNKKIDEYLIFERLTPSLDFFVKIFKKRYEHEKTLIWRETINSFYDFQAINNRIWGQTFNNDKLLFLKTLIQENALDKYKKIYKQFRLDLYAIYDSDLIYAFTELFQWFINKIYIKSSPFLKYFKCVSVQKIKEFPPGYYKQPDIIDAAFIKGINEILHLMGIYIFARRSTFIKTCRLCKYIIISQKYSKLSLDNIFKILRDFLIPSLQYYKKDPTVLFALQDLLKLFDFNKQQSLFLQSIKKKYLLPLQLMATQVQILQENNKLLNRISHNSDAKVYQRLKNLLICNSLSCMQVIVSRVSRCKVEQNQIIDKVIAESSYFAKKVMTMYLLLELSENERIFVQSNSKTDSYYQNIVNFMTYWMQIDPYPNIVSLIFDYFIEKIPFKYNSSEQLTNFQYFHGEIYFLSALFLKAFPIYNKMSEVSQGNQLYVSAGEYLQSKRYCLQNEMLKSEKLRKSLMQKLFNSQEIIQCNFYKIIIHLSSNLRKVILDNSYNFRIAAKIYDQAMFLILLITQMAHFESNTIELSTKYFSFHLFSYLTNAFGVPFEIAFTVLRKSLLCQTEYWKKQNWLTNKNYLVKAFSKNLFTSINQRKDIYKKIGFELISRNKLIRLISLDLFQLFWILDIESLFFNKNLYAENLTSKNANSKVNKSREHNIYDKEKFEFQLEKEMSTNEIRHAYIWDKEGKMMSKASNVCFRLTSEHEKQYCDLFLKCCIINRSLLSQRQAYYSWWFLIAALKQTQLPAFTFLKIICRLNYTLATILHFSTQKEAQSIATLANLSTDLMKRNTSRSQLQNKLRKYDKQMKNISTSQYQEINQLLYSCNSDIIEKIMESDEQIYSVKNNLVYLKKVGFIPFSSQYTTILRQYFEKIIYKHSELNSEIEDQVKNVLKEVEERDKQLTLFKRKREKIQDSMEFSQSQISQDRWVPEEDSTKGEDVKSTSYSESFLGREDLVGMNLSIVEEQYPQESINDSELKEEEIFLDFNFPNKKNRKMPDRSEDEKSSRQ